VGAGVPANTGEAGAIHRVACFAGMPAPTSIALRRDSGWFRSMAKSETAA